MLLRDVASVAFAAATCAGAGDQALTRGLWAGQRTLKRITRFRLGAGKNLGQQRFGYRVARRPISFCPV